MRRRLDVGLGIVHRPAVLFLDEPTTGLDPQARARMWDEIRGLREAGTTVFLTTHYLEEADALADRLAIIDHGRIVAEGTADELKRQVAGDVITIGVEGAVERVLEAVRTQPFVREARREEDLVRLYVDRATWPSRSSSESSTATGCGPDPDPGSPEPRRRLPSPDRPLAPRGARRLTRPHTTPTHHDRRSPFVQPSATPGSSTAAR